MKTYIKYDNKIIDVCKFRTISIKRKSRDGEKDSPSYREKDRIVICYRDNTSIYFDVLDSDKTEDVINDIWNALNR